MLDASNHGSLAAIINVVREIFVKPLICSRWIILAFHDLVAGRVCGEVLFQDFLERADYLIHGEWPSQAAITEWLSLFGSPMRQKYLFPSRIHSRSHLSGRQYSRLVCDWVEGAGLDPDVYGTQSLRRTKVLLIVQTTGNLKAAQLLLGHTKIESTARYLETELNAALKISEKVEL